MDLRHDRLRFYRSLVDGEYRDKTWTSKPGLTRIAALPETSVDLSRLLAP
ncbi:MAG TPA: hypothetical protein VF329_07080 [Gammaproteobacteria bacterium]